MIRKNLAKKLVAAKNEAERKRLLADNSNLADPKLALALKELCLTSFSVSPSETQKAATALKTLLKVNRNPETEAFCHWASGVSLITKGKFDRAIASLDRSAEIFTKIGHQHNSAQTQVAKLIPLALLGKNDEAVRVGKSALKILEKCGDQLGAGKVEMNLSNIVSRREHHREAEKYCLSALRRFNSLGEKTWGTMAENGLANTYAQLNDFRKAESFYARALKSAREAEMSVTEAEIEASMGNLATFRGKFDRALRFLELSRQKYETLEMPHQTAIAELEIADIYLELNLAGEAFAIFEKVAEKLHKLKMPSEEARARGNFGKSCAILGEIERAKVELKKSARLYIAEKNRVGAALVKLTEARVEIDSQNFQTALALVRDARKLLRKSENVRHKLIADWFAGEVLGNLKKTLEAEQVLKRTLTASLESEQKNIARSALNSLGRLALKTGDQKGAEKHFKKAVELVESLRAPLPAEEFRMAFLADKLAPFENLAKIYLSQKKWDKAFYYVENARSRSLAESLTGQIRSVDREKIPEGLAKKLESLREELNWFYSRLNRAEESEIEALQTEAGRLERQIAEVMRQIESTGERSRQSRTSRDGLSFSLKDLQDRLGRKRSLIEFVSFDGTVGAFVISAKKIDYVGDLAGETEILELLEGLRFQFGALRYGEASLQKFMPDLKKRADSYLQRLYEKLLKPLENNFGEDDLIVVPVGALHYVPFHALHNGRNYLIEERNVVHSPGATVWLNLESKKRKPLKTALFFGFADERIPLVEDEIKSLKKIFDRSRIFTGEKANFAAYTKNAPRFDVLHLACHGQFRPENPLFSSLHLADGFVTVRDICGQDLSAELVTLSACETGLNKVFAGDEILGLARGFLVAGSSSLVLSLWTVNDRATADLMKLFYAEIVKGKTASEALKIAQCNFIARDFHPYFWSPFAIIGK
ncbi:MAG: CHAT domain-containing protein [Pyrinomonadaceae bacterium]